MQHQVKSCLVDLNHRMKNKFLVLCLLVSAALLGCGGGGGGASSGGGSQQNNGVTTTVDVFVSGANSSLSYPKLMAFFGADLYVVDASSATSPSTGTVVKFSSSGARQSSIGSFIDPVGIAFFTDGTTFVTGRKPIAGTGLLELNRSTGDITERVVGINPYGIAVNTTNNAAIYVAAPSAGKVYIYNSAFSSIGTVGGVLVGNTPTALAFDSAQSKIYVTKNDGGSHGVDQIDTTSVSSPAVAFATSALFDKPNGIAVRNSPHEIYVVNTGTTESQSSVLKISSDGATVTTFLSASNAAHKLCSPIGAAINGNDLYVVNGNCTSSPNNAYARAILKIAL
jgi:DNA-binding beta-propeller fold protein YncE